ncbi:MAG: hypothetical protein AABY22_06785, partial [Nanoarchaeota archaeon]
IFMKIPVFVFKNTFNHNVFWNIYRYVSKNYKITNNITTLCCFCDNSAIVRLRLGLYLRLEEIMDYIDRRIVSVDFFVDRCQIQRNRNPPAR